jgi:hypothetical protein
MDWHNARADWMLRRDRGKKNAERKAAYAADPEYWRNKAIAWREAHPEQALLIAQQAKERYWEKPWLKMTIAAKGRALKRGMPFDLTYEWAEKRWTGFCELTGLPFAPRYDASSSIFSPSIDKIVPSKGYVQTNCRFILLGVNNLKHDGTDEEMYLVAKSLISHLILVAQKVEGPKP